MKSLRIAIAATAIVLALPGLSGACTLSATALNFGSFGLLVSPVDSTATISVTCPLGTPYQIGLSGTGGSGANNRLISGVNQIGYGLYKDAGRNDPWGDTGGSLAVGIGTGLEQQHAVFARIPVQSMPHVGAYSDTLIITINY